MEYPVALLGEQLLAVEKRKAALWELFDEAFLWADEVLAACKATFARPDLELLPKTPSFKRPVGRPRKTKKVLEEAEDCVEIPLRSRRLRKAVEESASPPNTRTSRSRCHDDSVSSNTSTRASRSSHKGRHTRQSRQSQMESDSSLPATPEMDTSTSVRRQTRRRKGKTEDLDASNSSTSSLDSSRSTRSSRRKQASQRDGAESQSQSRNRVKEVTFTPQTPPREQLVLLKDKGQETDSDEEMTPVPAGQRRSSRPKTPSTIKRVDASRSSELLVSTVKQRVCQYESMLKQKQTSPSPKKNSSLIVTPPTLKRAGRPASRNPLTSSPLTPEVVKVDLEGSQRSSRGSARRSLKVVSSKVKRTSSSGRPSAGRGRKREAGNTEQKTQAGPQEEACYDTDHDTAISSPSSGDCASPSHSARLRSQASSTPDKAGTPAADSAADAESSNNTRTTRTKTRNVSHSQTALILKEAVVIVDRTEVSRYSGDAEAQEAVADSSPMASNTRTKKRKLEEKAAEDENRAAASAAYEEKKNSNVDNKVAEETTVVNQDSSHRSRSKLRQAEDNSVAVSSNSHAHEMHDEPVHVTRTKTRKLTGSKTVETMDVDAVPSRDDDVSPVEIIDVDAAPSPDASQRTRTRTRKAAAAAAVANSRIFAESRHEDADEEASSGEDEGSRDTSQRKRTRTRKAAIAATAANSKILAEDEELPNAHTSDEEGRSTRTKTRTKTRNPPANVPYEIPIIVTSGESDAEAPVVRQSKRTKTRKASQASVTSPPADTGKVELADKEGRRTRETNDSGIVSIQPSEEDLLHSHSEEAEVSTRTRSKLRKLPVTEEETSVDASQPLQTAASRTKTRKRHAEENDSDTTQCSKRSCSEASFNQMGKGQPENILNYSGTTEDNSGSDVEMEDHTSRPNIVGKVIKPHPASFLNALKNNKSSGKLLTPISEKVTSLIKRNTPLRVTHQNQQDKVKGLQEKEKRAEERLKRREERKRQQVEALRKKTEQRLQKAAEMRKLREDQQRQKAVEAMQRAEKMATPDKAREDKIVELAKLRQKKHQEAEDRRKLDEQERAKKLVQQAEEERRYTELQNRKREFEEAERQRKLAEQHKQQVEREKAAAAAQEKERTEREKAEALAREKAEREKAEKEKAAKLQLEAQKQKELELRQQQEAQKKGGIGTSSKLHQTAAKPGVAGSSASAAPVLSKTFAVAPPPPASHPVASINSYAMTPAKKRNQDNYDISDLQSSDDTDDDENPRKKIPAWAQGANLKAAVINQYHNPPDFEALFPPILTPNLSVMFPKDRPRFRKRTSSACWDSPIYKNPKTS